MIVDRIGHVEPISLNRKTGRSEPRGGSEKTDTINLSTQAVEQAERYQVIELIRSAPDLDEARIVELRQRLEDPSYMNDRVIGSTADNILSAWFG
ncbi:MAG: flagellar biosynthesis anti-sigma factor FlgM [Treponema sp.]|nr:flagellar biosynthesis anti-sigma factor FlgM [Treponema sp.]